MKTIISLSLGSSKRDKVVETTCHGQDFLLERKGSDGSLEKMHEWIESYDGKVDIITLGGININLVLLQRSFPFRDAMKLVRAAKKTPVIDGEIFREHVEPYFVEELVQQGLLKPSQKVLFPLVSNRLQTAKVLESSGFQDIVYGDLIYDVGFPQVALRSLKAVNRLSSILGPVITRLPFLWFYPTGKKQEEVIERKPELFRNAEILAGDFHNIRRFLIQDLRGKTVLTNTVTQSDRELLKERGLHCLITVTPNLDGRSFGANLMNGMILSLFGKHPAEVTPHEYLAKIKEIGLEPAIEFFD